MPRLEVRAPPIKWGGGGGGGGAPKILRDDMSLSAIQFLGACIQHVIFYAAGAEQSLPFHTE